MLTIIQSIIPLTLLVIVGVVFQRLVPAEPSSHRMLCKIGLTECNSWTSLLNKFALYLSLPALIIYSLISSGSAELMSLNLIFFNIVLLLGWIGIIIIAVKLIGLPSKLANAYIFGGFLGNVAYIGFAFINSLYPSSAGASSILIAIHIAVAFTIGLYLLEKSKKQQHAFSALLRDISTNPLLISVVVGLALLSLNITLPSIIQKALQMLAESASPIVLVAIGTFMASGWSLDKNIKHSVIISTLKIIVMPLLFLFASLLLTQSVNLNISILQSAMPVALTNFALAEKYPMDKHVVSNAIIISTICSLITLSLFSYLII